MLKRSKTKFFLFFIFLIFLLLLYLAFVYFIHKPDFQLSSKDTISYSGFKATIDSTNVKINSIQISGSKDGAELIDIYANDQILDSGNEIKIKIEFKSDSQIVKMIRGDNLDHFYLHYSIGYENKFFTSFIKGKIELKIDFEPPSISNVNSDKYVYLGGIGFVTYDTSLDTLKSYVDAGSGNMFNPISVVGDNKISNLVFFSCFNIPCKNNKIIIKAEDKAGNAIFVSTTMKTIINKKWNISYIKIDNNFLLNKYNEVMKNNLETVGIKEFKELNIEERKKNDLLLSLQTSKITNKKLFDSKFLQMRNSQVFSKFSEKRIYYIDDVDKPVDSKYHFGIDLATTANANVYASNTGKVSYVNSNGVGIYGKVTIIDHGLGFYSLYSHLSDISVKVGDEVDKRTLIGKTGQTGYAYGDHLHFSTYIQGVPFDPIELWDKNYINLKIISIYNQFIAEATQ